MLEVKTRKGSVVMANAAGALCVTGMGAAGGILFGFVYLGVPVITGAILAKREGYRVLLLEKEKYLGGKIFSFEHSEFEPKEFKHLLYATARSTVIRSDPPIDEILKAKTFKDYIFEGGEQPCAGCP